MRRALCVGIDLYSVGALKGCVADAKSMAAVLRKHDDGLPNFECRLLLAPNSGKGDAITRSTLRQAIDKLFQGSPDVALLHFSGHGTYNNLDGYLVTQDDKRYDEGVAMSDVLKLANDSKAGEVVIFLDCCFSGNLGGVPAIDNAKALLREGVSILTASRSDQVSVESAGNGLFTSLVVDALSGGVMDVLGEVTAPNLYSFVETALSAWDQRPLFKSHVAKLLPLRRCKPPIDTAILRELPALFPVPAKDLPLCPECEATCEKKDDAKHKVFCKLQALNRVHLVVPVGEDHMYDAAMQSKACRLTAAGRYYWRLARDNRVMAKATPD